MLTFMTILVTMIKLLTFTALVLVVVAIGIIMFRTKNDQVD